MCMLKSMEWFALVPAAVLLALSFFVLAALRNIEAKALRAFGHVVTILLWGSALIVVTSLGRGGYGDRQMMPGMPPMMMQRQMMGAEGQGGIKPCQRAKIASQQAEVKPDAQKEVPAVKHR